MTVSEGRGVVVAAAAIMTCELVAIAAYSAYKNDIIFAIFYSGLAFTTLASICVVKKMGRIHRAANNQGNVINNIAQDALRT